MYVFAYVCVHACMCMHVCAVEECFSVGKVKSQPRKLFFEGAHHVTNFLVPSSYTSYQSPASHIHGPSGECAVTAGQRLGDSKPENGCADPGKA